MKISKTMNKWKDGNHEMFERAGCGRCSNGQLYSGGEDDCSVTYYDRCDCANVHTKRYNKFLKKTKKLQSKLSFNDFTTLKSLWYDNNSHIVVGNDCTDRSW
jgi:hypothetical protein